MSGDYGGFNQAFAQGFQQAQQNRLVRAQMEQQKQFQDAQLGLESDRVKLEREKISLAKSAEQRAKDEADAVSEDRRLNAEAERLAGRGGDAVDQFSKAAPAMNAASNAVVKLPRDPFDERVGFRAKSLIRRERAEQAGLKKEEVGAEFANRMATATLEQVDQEIAASKARVQQGQSSIEIERDRLKQATDQFDKRMTFEGNEGALNRAHELNKVDKLHQYAVFLQDDEQAARIDQIRETSRQEVARMSVGALQRLNELEVQFGLQERGKLNESRSAIATNLILQKEQFKESIIGEIIRANPNRATDPAFIQQTTQRISETLDSAQGAIVSATQVLENALGGSVDAASIGEYRAKLDLLMKNVDDLSTASINGDLGALKSLKNLENEVSSLVRSGPVEKKIPMINPGPAEKKTQASVYGKGLTPEQESFASQIVDGFESPASEADVSKVINVLSRSKSTSDAYEKLRDNIGGAWGEFRGKTVQAIAPREFVYKSNEVDAQANRWASGGKRGNEDSIGGDWLYNDVLRQYGYDWNKVFQAGKDAGLVGKGFSESIFQDKDRLDRIMFSMWRNGLSFTGGQKQYDLLATKGREGGRRIAVKARSSK